MSKIPVDNLDWASRLECPPSACTDDTKKILNRGIISYVWDELSSTIHPADDVLETRKNILLHYLRTQEKVTSIEQIQNTKRLKAEKALLNTQIQKLQADCNAREEAVQQKGLILAKIKQNQKLTKSKKNLLQLKYEEVAEEMDHAKEMLLVCKNLMPGIKSTIDENVMQQCLEIVGAISSRQDKHEAWKYVSTNLGDITIPELWKWLLNKRIDDTEKLINLERKPKNSENTISKSSHRFELGVAKARGRHFISMASKSLNLKKAEDAQEQVMNFIEQLLLCCSCEAMQDWISLVFEVTKLEKTQSIIQSEVDQMKEKIAEKEDTLNQRRLQLATDIDAIDSQMAECADEIKRSLIKLDSAPKLLLQMKNQLATVLDRISALQEVPNNDWLEHNLSSELEVFQRNLDIDALNKVILRGRVGAYRHASTCISNALMPTTTFTPIVPIYRVPLYQLIYCFRDLRVNQLLKTQKLHSRSPTQVELNLELPQPSINDDIIIELLDDVISTADNCRQEVENFNFIFEAWVNQPVQQAMAIIDNTVHGATYPEWVKRYNTLIYMLQRKK